MLQSVKSCNHTDQLLQSTLRSSPQMHHHHPQAPSGPITRAHARAIETEVTFLLIELLFNSHETWLPRAETLCILRCQGEGHEEAMGQDQELTRANEEKEKKMRRNAFARTIRTPSRTIRAEPPLCTSGRTGHPDPDQTIQTPTDDLSNPRTSGHQLGRPGRTPEAFT